MKPTNLKQKLISDGSNSVKLDIDLLSISSGVCMLVSGISCILFKALNQSHTGPEELFFLIPIGFLLMLCSAIVFSLIGIRNVYKLIGNTDLTSRYKCSSVAFGCASIVLTIFSLFTFLIMSGTIAENMLLGLIPGILLALLTAIATIAAIRTRMMYKKSLLGGAK